MRRDVLLGETAMNDILELDDMQVKPFNPHRERSARTRGAEQRRPSCPASVRRAQSSPAPFE
jgi:hypothetical protein